MRDFWIWLGLAVAGAVVAYVVRDLLDSYLEDVVLIGIAAAPGAIYLALVLIRQARERSQRGHDALTPDQRFTLEMRRVEEQERRRQAQLEFWSSEPGCLTMVAGLLLAGGLAMFLLLLARMYLDTTP